MQLIRNLRKRKFWKLAKSFKWGRWWRLVWVQQAQVLKLRFEMPEISICKGLWITDVIAGRQRNSSGTGAGTGKKRLSLITAKKHIWFIFLKIVVFRHFVSRPNYWLVSRKKINLLRDPIRSNRCRLSAALFWLSMFELWLWKLRLKSTYSFLLWTRWETRLQ